MKRFLTAAAMIGVVGMAGCKSAAPPATAPVAQPAASLPRPDVAAPAFKVFHHDASSVTLVTKDDASDAEISSLIWELRDAAHAHSFDKIGIDQKLVDARDPMMWFHIYRGAKCASEKYASGAPPCGASYHAAGDYTLGGFSNRDQDSGALVHGDDVSIQLWNAGSAYTAPGAGK
jgi:hypothetical protein